MEKTGKCYGRTDVQTDAQTDGQTKVIPIIPAPLLGGD